MVAFELNRNRNVGRYFFWRQRLLSFYHASKHLWNSICLFVHLSICSSVCLYDVCPSVRPSIRPSVRQPVHHTGDISSWHPRSSMRGIVRSLVHPSVDMSIHWSVCLSVSGVPKTFLRAIKKLKSYLCSCLVSKYEIVLVSRRVQFIFKLYSSYIMYKCHITKRFCFFPNQCHKGRLGTCGTCETEFHSQKRCR